MARRERQISTNDIAEAKRTIIVVQEKADRLPWVSAAVLGGLCVAAGYQGFGMPGALGGVVVGFFLGQATIQEYKANAKAQIRTARVNLRIEEENAKELQLRPSYFTVEEQESGRDG